MISENEFAAIAAAFDPDAPTSVSSSITNGTLAPKLAALAAELIALECRLWAGVANTGGQDAVTTLGELSTLAHGRSLTELAQGLLDAVDPQSIRAAAELLAANEGGCACSGDEPPAPTQTQVNDVTECLARGAIAPFTNNAEFRARLVAVAGGR